MVQDVKCLLVIVVLSIWQLQTVTCTPLKSDVGIGKSSDELSSHSLTDFSGDENLLDKKDWGSKFATWGKRGWNDASFAPWGKREGRLARLAAWGKRRPWSNFNSWGKRTWSNFNTWGKRWPNSFQTWGKRVDAEQPSDEESNDNTMDKRQWNQFVTWGKRSPVDVTDKRKWSSLGTWGKRTDELSEDDISKRKWASLNTWGKRDWKGFASWGKRSNWKGFSSWGKRSDDTDKIMNYISNTVPVHIAKYFDKNGDGALDEYEASDLIASIYGPGDH